MTDFGNQSYYMEQQKEELLEVAKQIQNNLSNELIKATLNSVFNEHQARL